MTLPEANHLWWQILPMGKKVKFHPKVSKGSNEVLLDMVNSLYDKNVSDRGFVVTDESQSAWVSNSLVYENLTRQVPGRHDCWKRYQFCREITQSNPLALSVCLRNGVQKLVVCCTAAVHVFQNLKSEKEKTPKSKRVVYNTYIFVQWLVWISSFIHHSSNDVKRPKKRGTWK